jgi:hypothetical protein
MLSWRDPKGIADSFNGISYLKIPVNHGDCLTCIAKEAGIFDASMWIPPTPCPLNAGNWPLYAPFEDAIINHPYNQSSGVIYQGLMGDYRINAFVNGQVSLLAVPFEMSFNVGDCIERHVQIWLNGTSNQGRCYCRNQCPPGANCGSRDTSITPTPQPSGSCDLIATNVRSHGFKIIEFGAFVFAGGKTSVTVLWDANDSFFSPDYVGYFTVEAGLGLQISILNPFRFLESIRTVLESVRGLNKIDFSVGGYDYVFSEASLDEIAGASGNLSAKAIIFELGAGIAIANGCPTTGELGIDLNVLRQLVRAQWTVGASGTGAGTDVLYDGRSNTLFPNSFFLPH